MKNVNVKRVIYSNGEKLVFFQKQLDIVKKRIDFLEGKVEALKLLDPEEYTEQDWSSDIQGMMKLDRAKGSKE